ncbi:MAG: carboxypeptidase regulatory-like domain-containing protein [Candidatus Aminicenantes bacterium]|nr:carboxypeptidase regulatory-like domain-containing protein [Candidatus Aminicenantes bacterium]
MHRLSSFIAISFLCGSLLAAADAGPLTTEQRVAFDLRGRVEDMNGVAVSGARVILLNASGPAKAPRQTRSDSQGEWLFRQVKPGKWKIQALNPNALSEIYHLTISWRQDNRELMPVILKLEIKAHDILAEGKAHLYNHEWESAQRALDFFTTNFIESPMLEEALFWNAYACFRRSRNHGGDAPAMRRKALMMISHLLEKYAEGPWSDDARVLRLDLWCDQLRAGDRKDLKPLLHATDSEKESDARVRRAAIEILIPIKPQFAWDSLLRELAATQSAKLRGDLLILITRFPANRAIAELNRVAQTDPDSMVRAKARYWLQRLSRLPGADSSGQKTADQP